MSRPSSAEVRRRSRQLLLVPVLAVAASVVVLPAGGPPSHEAKTAAPPVPAHTTGPETFRATTVASSRPTTRQSGRKSH